MTVQELLLLVRANPWASLAFFGAIPLSAWLMNRIRNPYVPIALSPCRWGFAVAVYAACLPGLLSAVLLVERVSRGELRNVDLMTEVLPLGAMLLTLGQVLRVDRPSDIPGVGRLTAFLVGLGLLAVGLMVLNRMRVWLIFGGGLGAFLAIGIGGLLLMQLVFRKALGPRQD